MKRPGPLPPARAPRPKAEAPRPPSITERDAREDDPSPEEFVGGGVSGFRRFADRAAHPGSDETPHRGDAAEGRDDRADLDWPDEPDREVGWFDVARASWARRRALRAEARRFTARTRRRRAYWLGSLGAVALLIVGTLAAAYSPLFAVREITVAGADRVDEAAVAAALEDQIGTPMPLVDHSAVQAAMLDFPLVETYRIESRPPHELVVRLVERTPVGVVASAAGYTVVDAAGVALSTTEKLPEGQPLIDVTGGTSSDAFAAAGQVLRSLPAGLRGDVAEVTATTPNDVAMTLAESGAEVVWGDAEDSALKALVLERVMADRPTSDASVYDVSSPNAAVVR